MLSTGDAGVAANFRPGGAVDADAAVRAVEQGAGKRYTHITETSAIEAAGRVGRALWDG